MSDSFSERERGDTFFRPHFLFSFRKGNEFCDPILFFLYSEKEKNRVAPPRKERDDQRTFRMVLWTLHRPEPCSGLAAYGSLGFCRIRRQRNERHQQDRVRHGQCFRFCMARFLFFLKEKEKNGFGKLQLIIDIRRNIPDIILQSGC